MFYSVKIFRTSSPRDSISSNPEKTASRRWGDEPGYIEVLQQRAGSLNIKRLLIIKENQIFQAKEFRTFVCMGRCKSLDSLRSFLWYAPRLLGPVSYIFHILSSSESPLESGYYLMATTWFFSFLGALKGWNRWQLWHPCLLIWQEIFQFALARSWWRGLKECGPLEKGMANHFSILALRTPWTVWKGKMIGYWKRNSPGW